MKSILVISHGTFGKGLVETAEIFFGKIKALDYLLLTGEETAESFRKRLCETVNQMDEGEGVLILADLYGGTPCNQTIYLSNLPVHVIAGVNLGMLMEAIALRDTGDLDYDELIKKSQNNIVDFTKKIQEKRNRKEEKAGR